MVTQLINIDPKAIQLTQIQPNQLAQILPVLSVGQIMPLTVRQNDAGQGLISLRGQLMQAKVPPELKEGSRVFVQLTEAADKKVVFKLLPDLPVTTQTNRPAVQGFTQLAENLQRSVASRLANFQSFTLPEPSSLPEPVREPFIQLIKTFNFESPEKFTADIKSLAQGKVPTQLREVIDLSRPPVPPPDLREIFTALKAGIETQISLVQQGEPPQLSRLFRTTDFLLPDPAKVQSRDRPEIELIFRELANLKTSEGKVLDKLTNLLSRINQVVEQQQDAKKPEVAKVVSEGMKDFVQKLENVTRAQESLAMLNPLMQAIGEPALILFPLLLDGLLNTGELVVDPPPEKKVDEDGEGENSDKNTEGYQRVSITVPLAGMGPVQVDIAHRKDELLASITLEDPEAAAFLFDKLESLASQLGKFGFKNAEITANVGKVKEIAPEWTNTLRKAVSIVA